MTFQRRVFHRYPITAALVVAVMLPAVVFYFAKGGIA